MYHNINFIFYILYFKLTGIPVCWGVGCVPPRAERTLLLLAIQREAEPPKQHSQAEPGNEGKRG
jgi:hypothetical protein